MHIATVRTHKFVVELSKEEADLLVTLLAYFRTASRDKDHVEYAGRNALSERIGERLSNELTNKGAEFVYGINN
jgi:hypothetical protein